MPEWMWAIVIGVVLVGLIAYIRHTDDRRFEALEERFQAIGNASEVLKEKVRNLEIDYNTMHLWKNSALPLQMENGYKNFHSVMERIERDLSRRLDRIEKHLNGELR